MANHLTGLRSWLSRGPSCTCTANWKAEPVVKWVTIVYSDRRCPKPWKSPQISNRSSIVSRSFRILSYFLFALVGAGCNSAKTVDAFGLRTVDLVVGGVPLKAEVAED